MKAMDELPAQYNPKDYEEKIYKLWEDSGFFNPDVCADMGITQKNAPYFSIALPPPNVTGTLHLGHVFEHTLQDIMIRYHRMKGEQTLWLPGTDHAAIATQSKYEKELYKTEKKSRHDFDRNDFFNQIQNFALKNQSQILSQFKKIGDSVDWSRLAFTLDEKRRLAVYTAFKKMYDNGLIYRSFRIVNWDPKGQTTISDDEVLYEETESKLYTFRYSKNFPIPIATTRPETKVGDVAVAVNPSDKRYKKFIGKTYKIDFVGIPLEITIIGDSEIDHAYGTGAVGVTPAHSTIDWEIALRHKLPFKKVINEYAKMENVSNELNGKKTTEAREIMIEKLRSAGLLEKEEKIKNNIAKAERTGGIVEPLPKLQWFVNVNKKIVLAKLKIPGINPGNQVTLKEIMHKAVSGGGVKIIPDHFEKIYYHWIDNLKDWCISRQILYGHRIPAWFHEPKCVPKEELGTADFELRTGQMDKCKEVIISETEPKCEFCDAEYIQDPDTLDTWFSSSLWTFSTLGWPFTCAQNQKGELLPKSDLARYHPTSVINPGYEILNLWVSRMIMMSGYLLGEVPFRLAYFHGIVRDKGGKKFSKSLNSGIDPNEIIKKYGADALRMSLVVGVSPGNDVKFDINKVRAYQHFANKIWNAARFIFMKSPLIDKNNPSMLTPEDKTILDEFESLKKEVSLNMDGFDFYLAAEKLYHYFWHTFADKIIESAKPRLAQNGEDATSAAYTLQIILEGSLKLLHPFMPFVTEVIWQELYKGKKMLMVEKW